MQNYKDFNLMSYKSIDMPDPTNIPNGFMVFNETTYQINYVWNEQWYDSTKLLGYWMTKGFKDG